jgi:asparagine synthetase B (glutamine-hydrolysing)
VPIEGFGYAFLNHPSYADVTENDELICVKLGYVHDGARLLTTADIVRSGWAGPGSIDVERLHGGATIVVLGKVHPSITVYRSLLSPAVVNYAVEGQSFLAADNLRVMALMMPAARPNEDVLPQHMLFRAAYGRDTYVRQVSQLLVGEVLEWGASGVRVDLRRSLRDLAPTIPGKPVNQETSAWFLEEMRRVLAIYLGQPNQPTAMLLSGGVDSSLVQAVINTASGVERPFASLSYAVDTPSFDYEIRYAREASSLLGTSHTLVPILPEDYPGWLTKTIRSLGRPIPDDVRPCFSALFHSIRASQAGVRRLIHAQMADSLNGMPDSQKLIQGDKYRRWPVPILELLGTLLSPVLPSKAYGARTAAAVLRSTRDQHSASHFLNEMDLYTDMGTLQRCFPAGVIQSAFNSRRALEPAYLGSDVIVEQANMLGLFSDGMDCAGIIWQQGAANGLETVSPFHDDALVETMLAFDPAARYCAQNRVKPILKIALETILPTSETERPKGWSGIGIDLMAWMQGGVLSGMVHAIERPGFMTQADFNAKVERPDWFTWNLLTYDLFKKSFLG